MDKWLLKLVRLCNGLFRRQGIDTDHLYAIVETKLMMDKRRVYMNWRQGQQENRNHLNVVLIVYGLFGLFAGAAVMSLPFLTGMVIVHAYFIFMLAMTLITDFSTVLLDTADNQILLPRPVSSRTFFTARLIHILIYLLQFTIVLSIMPIIFTFVKYGFLPGTGICITILLSVLVAVFFTYLLYMLILRFSNEEKVRDIVTYFQIGMTIFFTVGYQVLLRVVDLSELAEPFEIHWYSYLIPPVWMAMLLEGVYTFNFDAMHITMTGLAIFVPVALFWLMNKYLAPSFSRKLAALNTDGARVVTPAAGKKKDQLAVALSGFFCKLSVERGAFEFTWKMAARDKSFKLQFYPGMAYIAFFIFVIVFNGGRNFEEQWAVLSSTAKYLPLIYIPLLSVSGGIIISTFNENFQASWIYYSAPVADPGEIIAGSLKALFVKFFFPVYALLFAFCLYIWGAPVIDDFVFGFFSNAACFFAFALFSQYYLPFSRQPNTKQQTGRLLNVFLQLFIIGALIGLHYLIKNYTVVMYLITGMVIAGCWLLVRTLRRVSWRKIAI